MNLLRKEERIYTSSKKMLFALLKAPLYGALLSALLCSTAFAAETTEEKKETFKLESVTVTANKMEEEFQDVPQSITVLDEISLEERGKRDLGDIFGDIPGMSYTTMYGYNVNYRGLNTSIFALSNPVTMYVDGVGYSGVIGFDASLENVQRVEVLRGPQSTLYGKDAMGAVINIITKDPTNEWVGKAGTEFGNMGHIEVHGNANGPLIEDTLYLGLSGRAQRDEGWMKNDVPGMEDNANRERNYQLNGYLLYTPIEPLRIRLAAQHSHELQHMHNNASKAPGARIEDFDRDSDAKHTSYDVEPHHYIDNDAQSLHASYEFEAVKIDSVTAHKTIVQDSEYDADGMAQPLFAGLKQYYDMDLEAWEQEFRISSTASKGFRWTGGLYFDMETMEHGPYGMEYPNPPNPNAFFHAESTCKSNTQAAFAQVMVPLSEQFELTLGGRFQRVNKSIDVKSYNYPIGAPTAPFLTMDESKTWTAFLPKAALSYTINDNWTTYVSYSKGYMPGGFNYFPEKGTVEDNTFEPEFTTNYEWGIKAGYDQVRFAASLYYMAIEDLHVYKANAGGNGYDISNAEKAHSKGIELEMTYLPLECLELTANLSVVDARYDRHGTEKFYDGERIEQTPSHSGHLGVAYHHPAGFYATLDGYYYGSRTFHDMNNKDFAKADGYGLLDTKIGYRINDSWELYGYVKNITDTEYITKFHGSNFSTIVQFGDPRTFGAGFNFYF